MSPTAQLPIAFFSFTHNDNDSLGGKLEALRDRLEKVIRTHTGLTDFQLFIDKDRENGISWGQKWAERINEALHQSVFLIPIVSPTYLNRLWCREELIEVHSDFASVLQLASAGLQFTPRLKRHARFKRLAAIEPAGSGVHRFLLPTTVQPKEIV